MPLIGRASALAAILLLALAGGACGGSGSATASGTVSCTATQTVTGGGRTLSERICTEETGASAAQADQIKQQCMVPSGGAGADGGISQKATFATGPCSHDGAIGGCRVTLGAVAETVWYYGADVFTTAEIQQLCSTGGFTFVAP